MYVQISIRRGITGTKVQQKNDMHKFLNTFLKKSYYFSQKFLRYAIMVKEFRVRVRDR